MTTPQTTRERTTAYLLKGFLGLAVLAVSGFIGMKLYPLVHGPSIELKTLSDGQSVSEPMVSLSGKALHTKNLIVNGTSLPLSPDGSFNDKIVLNPGYNVISFSARDRFGTTSSHDYAIVLTEPRQMLTLNTSPIITH